MKFKLFNIKKNLDTRGSSFVFEFSKYFKNNFKRIYISENKKIGTIRGLHFQKKYRQNKLLLIESGSIYDVLININIKSKNYKKIYTFKLGYKNKFNCIYIPSDYAHGFQTLSKNTRLVYLIDNNFETKNELIRYNDKKFNIKWPKKKILMSQKDNKETSYLL